MKDELGEQLSKAIEEYNSIYESVSERGKKLHELRMQSAKLLQQIEELVNSIAKHPKEFDAEIAEIQVLKKEFKGTCEFGEKMLKEAKKSAVNAGAGVAGGAAVASMAPSAAMWIATTFGTASTGTAISSLSGAAATQAALAWIGGGALTAGGGGVAAGQAFLALAGPIGWGIAGVTLLGSIVLFAGNKLKISKMKKEETEAVLNNLLQMKEMDAKLQSLLKQTEMLNKNLTEQYRACENLYGKNFFLMLPNKKLKLGAMVNTAKALAATLGVHVGSELNEH